MTHSLLRLAERLAIALGLCFVMVASSGWAREAPAPLRVEGTFTVKVSPQAQVAGNPAQALVMDKVFSGGLDGRSTGMMLGVGEPKPGAAAAYVAIERFEGSLDGRRGGFVLMQRGAMTRAGKTRMDVVIAADSGNGELAGIAGRMVIRIDGGVHRYALRYRLPAGPAGAAPPRVQAPG